MTTALCNINLVITSSNKAEVRAIIKFSSDIWKTPIETFKMIHTTVYHEGLTRALGFKRHKRFRRKIFASWWQGQGLETKNWKLRHNVNLGRAWYWSAFNSFGLSNHGLYKYMDCLHDIDWIFAHVQCICSTYAEGQWKGDSKSFLKHYDKKMRTNYEAIMGSNRTLIVFIKPTHHLIQQHPHC